MLVTLGYVKVYHYELIINISNVTWFAGEKKL